MVNTRSDSTDASASLNLHPKLTQGITMGTQAGDKTLIANPIWKTGPKICAAEWLPAYPTAAAAGREHQRYSPSCKITRLWQCDYCDQWHIEAVAPDPAGNSSGTGRSSKGKS